jgi:hypothetical protein
VACSLSPPPSEFGNKKSPPPFGAGFEVLAMMPLCR